MLKSWGELFCTSIYEEKLLDNGMALIPIIDRRVVVVAGIIESIIINHKSSCFDFTLGCLKRALHRWPFVATSCLSKVKLSYGAKRLKVFEDWRWHGVERVGEGKRI